MQKLSLEYLKPGMVIAKKIFDNDGRVLLRSGTVIDNDSISLLKELKINNLYIVGNGSEDIQVNDIISDETRTVAISNMKEIFNQLKFDDSVDRIILDRTVRTITGEVFQNRNALVNMTDVRSYDAYIFAHSVNVAMLSILTGIFLGYNHKQLEILGLGALLHDLGKIRIDKEILYKPGPLTEEEYDEVKRHAEIGYEMLIGKPEVPGMVAEIAYQHHERLDGSGYPRGLLGHQIHEFSRIVAITNVFDALLADRPYRRAFLPHEAAEKIVSSDKQFDQRIARVFLNNIAIYPMGSVVELNSGDIGVVIDVNKGQQTKPIIRLFCESNRQRIKDLIEVDLSKDVNLYIVRVLKDDQLCEFLD